MKDRRGFTLVEIIAAVIIIGVLALIIVPSVSGYIKNSRNTAYNAHETAMEEAAKSMTVEVINGKDNFALPKRGNFTNVTLKELVDKELIKGLQDPQTGEKCNDDLSYVIITAVDDNSYDYQACLYCGGYVTDSDKCDGTGIDDSTPPICGTITGESSEWTNKSRTISVGCSDPESSCKKSKYSQTFNSTMETAEISIYNSVGLETKCPVTVKVDKSKPTCELEIVGDDNIESTGWSSGRNVVIKMTSYSDGANESGVATYGMGTSSKKPNYNGNTSYEILNVSGTTTVFGYVKDNAGNEGMCYTTVTTGLEKPVFDPRYGYQIYPEKERFTTNNVSITATNKLKTSASGEHTITFNHMDKYKKVTAVIVELGTAVTDPASWKLTVGGNTYTADAETTTRLRFNIETEPNLHNISSSSEYTLKLGTLNNKEYTINRIEVEQIEGNIKAKYEVAVNLITRKQVVRTTQWSWDNGLHWDNKYYARFDVRNNAKSGTAKVKNDIPLVSAGVPYSIVKGDGDAPTIDLSSSNTNWTNQDITLTAKTRDTNTGIIGYMWSTNGSLDYYDSNWNYFDAPKTSELTYTYPVSVNGKYYFYAKDDAGNVNVKLITVSNIDKLKPTCNPITGQASLSCSDAASTTEYGQSKIYRYYFDTESNPALSSYKEVKPVTASFSINETATKGNGSRYYVYVIDQAGNRSDSISDLYYTVTYDGNTGTTPSKTSDIRRKTTDADLSPTSTKTGYTFLGWNTSKTSKTALSSYTVNSNVTLYATWKLNKPTNVTITGASEKIYGSSNTTLTCTQDRDYDNDVTLYYSFGYSTTDGGNPDNWSTDSTSNKFTVGKTDYYGDRYYSCRVYAKNSYLLSDTVTSKTNADQLVRYNNATITFNGNTGTVSGTNPVYVRTGESGAFTGIRNNKAATLPTASKSCYTFTGWYTATSGGSKILKDNNAFTGTAVSGYTTKTAWATVVDRNLYAQYTAHTYSLSYNLDKGSYGTNHPTGATYDTAFTVNNPSKSVTVKFDLNGTGATATTTDITKSYTFSGWNITGMDGVTHYYDSKTTTSASISSTTATSYKNLLCNAGTVNFLALWTPPEITLPTVTKTGYTCKWTSDTYEWVSGGKYKPASSGGVTSRTMKAVCTPNIYTITLDKQSGSGGTTKIYEKYDTGWYSNSSATTSISEITAPTRTGYIYDGHYTSTGGSGTKIIGSNKKIVGANNTFASDSTIYAKWNPITYTLSYDLDKGTHGTSHPTSATYDVQFTVDNPTKSVTLSFDLGSSGGKASSTNDITKSYTFNGWKITGMDTDTHYYGSSTTEETTINSTKAKKYKNLRSTSGTVSFAASWSPPSITLPTITRKGFTCEWKSGSYTWASGDTYTPAESGGATSRTMTGNCNPNPLIFDGFTITKTYNDSSSQTATINEATNGTGNTSYTEVSEKKGSTDTNVISISGTTITIAKAAGAGTYTYVVKATDTESGSTKNATFTIVINKASSTVTCISNLVYNGSDQLLATGSGCSTSSTGKNAGDHSVSCTGDANHNNSSTTCSIGKAASSVSCNSLTYNGNAQTLATGSGCTTTNTGTNATSYSVTCTGDSNHYDSSTTCSIAKANSSVSCNSLTYNGNAQTLATGSGCSTSDTGTNAGDYSVSCTGDANHNDSSTTCSIAKAASSVSCLTPAYTGDYVTLASGSGCSSLSNNSAINASSTYTVTCNGDSNHNNSSATCGISGGNRWEWSNRDASSYSSQLWQYYNQDGVQVTSGWVQTGRGFVNPDQETAQDWYYFSGGNMMVGWHQIGGKWYFMWDNDGDGSNGNGYLDGCMMHDVTLELNWSGGRDTFKFDSSGACVSGPGC